LYRIKKELGDVGVHILPAEKQLVLPPPPGVRVKGWLTMKLPTGAPWSVLSLLSSAVWPALLTKLRTPARAAKTVSPR